MHEILIATALTTGLLATPPAMQPQPPRVIATAMRQADWQAFAPATAVIGWNLAR